MKLSYAASCGALLGALVGLAICILCNISWQDSVYRIAVLAFGAAWMGMLLALLGQLLSPKTDEHKP